MILILSPVAEGQCVPESRNTAAVAWKSFQQLLLLQQLSNYLQHKWGAPLSPPFSSESLQLPPSQQQELVRAPVLKPQQELRDFCSSELEQAGMEDGGWSPPGEGFVLTPTNLSCSSSAVNSSGDSQHL